MAITRPVNLQKPFADAGAKNTIPVASQIGIDSGAASWTDGFPPLTRTPIAAGGIPPKGTDMNGVLNAVSAHTVFQNSGGRYRFDAALAAAAGGYPKGCVLQADDGLLSYLNVIEGNSTNFNTTPASIGVSWLPVGMARATTAQAQAFADDATVLTPKKLDDAFKGANQNINTGYQRLPGGLIFQWSGSLLAPANSGQVRWNFPITFPNKLLSYSLTSASSDSVISGSLPSATGITAIVRLSTSGGIPAAGVNAAALAIGH